MAIKILWTIVGLALASVFFAFLTIIEAIQGGLPESRSSAHFGFLAIAGILGIPGGVALHRARSAEKHKKLLKLIEAFVASRDAIGTARLAQAIQRSEIETEALLLELIEAKRVDLVFHRSREEYLHRGRISRAHKFLDTCTSCGGKLRSQVIFAGEHSACEYCNAPLTPVVRAR